MEFLNENFKTIDDLRKIDNILNDLNKEREAIEKLIVAKDDTEEQDEMYEKIQQQSNEISLNLNTLLKGFLDKRLSIKDCNNELSLLVSTYGELSLFENVFKKLNEIDQLRSDQTIITQFHSLYDELTDLENSEETSPEVIISTLQRFGYKIEDFRAEFKDNSLKNEIIESLNIKLSSLITEKFKSLFINEKLEIPYATELRNLLLLQSLDPINLDSRPLWCLQSLIKKNFELKFKFHYDSNVETNALDKPEWFMKFVHNWIAQNLELLNNRLSKIFQNTPYERESFKEQYVLSVTELLKYKIKKNLNLIYRLTDEKVSSNLLMHLIEEMLKNDDYFLVHFKVSINLVDQLILSDEKITKKWLEFEKNFNFTKFERIISNDESFQIDFESVDKAITKPTNSSILVKNLLNNLNSKYRLIKNLNFKLSLLSQIQLRILERYYERLEELLDAFNSLFRKFKILKHKSDDEDIINGVNGIDRLLRIYCSLQYIIEAMESWNENLLFIQLSHLIREETFFNALIVSYRSLLQKVIKVIDEFMNREINTSLKSYFKLTNWSSLEKYEGVITLELKNGVNQLSTLTNYLRRTLSLIDLIPILYNFEEKLIKFFNESILNLNTFNENGALQVYFDYQQSIEMLGLYENLKNYIKFLELFKFLTIVDRKLMNSFNSGNYSLQDSLAELCQENELVSWKNDFQMMSSVAKRKVI